ncbi:hypothetical protein BJ973_002402 [Actinoplanes tereljensis]|uniref:Mini-circle protein n=1 Tax=Paractinoplanes tereljensis TaxID=571912 RepID=A0A919NNG8_9ACTN|nr:DinB family protein [Actinoplanes tereljensis]GIF22075.1 hypothetical protein Ate02nite_48050 [Actinoplanes tereljensis]
MAKRANLFPADDDPRTDGLHQGDERATLVAFLRDQRLTLQVKCGGLTASDLAARSVPPSTMSLLGLVRHCADVERQWFRQRLAGLDVALRFQTAASPDGDFDGAVADAAVVAEAWQAWREECSFTDTFVAAAPDLAVVYEGVPGVGRISLREVLVHMIEEYARHNGHADLLRERIDGRIGQ